MSKGIKSEGYLHDLGYERISWFCIQTHLKHGQIARICLVKVGRIELLNSQSRTHRAIKRGPVLFTESVFPGYKFAQLNFLAHLETIYYSTDISKLVEFSSIYPNIPDFQVNELKAVFVDDKILVLNPNPEFVIGDTAQKINGAFHFLLVVVRFVQPVRLWLRALLDFLGRMMLVVLGVKKVTVGQCF